MGRMVLVINNFYATHLAFYPVIIRISCVFTILIEMYNIPTAIFVQCKGHG